MTIRRRLNLAMLAMLGLLLFTTGVVVYTVQHTSTKTIEHAHMRELSVFTDGVRAEVFYRVALREGFQHLREYEGIWPGDVLDDVAVRINLASDPRERTGWMRVRDGIETLAALPSGHADVSLIVRGIETQLRKLRRHYDRVIADAVASTAKTSATAQAAAVGCAMVSALFFAIVTLLIRDWLVKPLRVLSESVEEIGGGNLAHRVPLAGRDELSHLARGVETMAERLADHQRQLVESREMAAIGEMCSNVAHGLRNPLAGMRAGAQLAQRHGSDEELAPLLDDIVAEIDRMDERITQLFAYARITELNRTPTTFADLAEDAHAEARGVLDSKNITLQTHDRTGGVTWPVDREKLASAVGELITNAAHHSNAGSVVTVSGTLTPRHNGAPPQVHVSVIDHGRGIPPTVLDRLFELFFTTRPDGTGMGLPLVRRIVRRHDGEIRVTSKQGEGTHVELAFAAA